MSVLCECPKCHRKQSVANKKCKGQVLKDGVKVQCGAELDRLKKNRKVRYWIDYYLPNGTQRREPVVGEDLNPYSIEDAKKMLSKRVVQKVEKQVFDIRQDSKWTFQQLTDWYLERDNVKALASYKTIKIYLGKFNTEYGNRIISTIKSADLEDLQEKRKREGLKPKTIDDEINYAKTMVSTVFLN